MSDYICKYGLYHDKACQNGEPSSNNGWIYTAYAYALGVNVYTKLNPRKIILDCFNFDHEDFILNRLPNKTYPPLSKDELIGMVTIYPDFRFWKSFHYTGWKYFREWQKTSLLEQLKAVWSLRNKHRNFVWKNNVRNAYPIVFRLGPSDRYYVKNVLRQQTSLFETLAFYMSTIAIALGSNTSAKNLRWLQLYMLGSTWCYMFKQKENFMEYFGAKHPFNQ